MNAASETLRRRRTRHRVLALVGALLLVVPWTLSSHSSETLAIWTDAETGTGFFTATTVPAPTGLACGATGLLQPVRYNWIAPAGSITGYAWTASGTPGGTLPSSATSITLSQGLLGLGGGRTFTLWATGEGGWTSTPVTGTFGVIGILGLTAVSSCSVP